MYYSQILQISRIYITETETVFPWGIIIITLAIRLCYAYARIRIDIVGISTGIICLVYTIIFYCSHFCLWHYAAENSFYLQYVLLLNASFIKQSSTTTSTTTYQEYSQFSIE